MPVEGQKLPIRARNVARATAARPLLLALCLALGPAAFAANRALQVYDVPTAEHLARTLYDQERRVGIASEMVRDYYDPEQERIVGFVTQQHADGLTVRFIRAGADGLEPVIDAVFDRELLLPALKAVAGEHLSPAEVAQAKARQQVASDVQSRCNGRYNTLVTTEPAGKRLLVYGIGISDTPDRIMVGGHVRFTVSADGERIERVEPLSSTCAVVGRDQFDSAADSEGTKGVGMRSPLADVPLETHALMSLLYDVPLFVMTADKAMWKVQQGKMTKVKGKPGEAAK